MRGISLGPSHLSPDHISPSHLGPSHLGPDHISPDHIGPSHLSPDHCAADGSAIHGMVGHSSWSGWVGQHVFMLVDRKDASHRCWGPRLGSEAGPLGTPGG